MKVAMTFEFAPVERRALKAHFGQTGLAGREDFRTWIEENVNALLSDLVDQQQNREIAAADIDGFNRAGARLAADEYEKDRE